VQGWLARNRVTVAAAIVAAATGAGGTALALPPPSSPHVASMAGSDVLDVSLPVPSGTVPFLFAGGASQFLLSLPGGVPARLTLGGGAAFVRLDSQDLTGVAGGTVLASPGWATARSRFVLDATAGVSRLTVSRW
jgi:hypothetical protein